MSLHWLRGAGIALPQILVLLVAGASLDLLGGWNHGDQAFGTLLALFLLAPLATVVLLITEVTVFVRSRKKGRGRRPWPILIAMLLVMEALAVDLLILSQARM